MIFIYTELTRNKEPHTFALEFGYDEDNAANMAPEFPKSIFFFADLAVPEEVP